MIKTFLKNNLPKNFLKSDVRSEGNFSVFYFFWCNQHEIAKVSHLAAKSSFC